VAGQQASEEDKDLLTYGLDGKNYMPRYSHNYSRPKSRQANVNIDALT